MSHSVAETLNDIPRDFDMEASAGRLDLPIENPFPSGTISGILYLQPISSYAASVFQGWRGNGQWYSVQTFSVPRASHNLHSTKSKKISLHC